MRMSAVFCFSVLLSTPAWADDFTPTIDEASGNWIAVSFQDGPETKVCAAGTVDHKMTFRADANDIEFRTGNDSWSLSAEASGDVVVKVGDVSKTFHLQTLDATTLAGAVTSDDVTALFDAMDKAPSASLTFGTKKPTMVSLAGSTRALNSFRTCSATHGFGKLGASAGANASPF